MQEFAVTTEASPSVSTGDRPGLLRHLRNVMLLPVQLSPLPADGPIENHHEVLLDGTPNNPWHELDDEFGDPAEFQERHYNEFVTFLPPVQRFLYGQGIGRSVKKNYDESPIRVLRRNDVARVRVVLGKGDTPIELHVQHVDLYFYFDIDVALLAVEVYADDVPIHIAQKLLFRLGRAYPAYWEADGSGGHCPWSCEWLAADGRVLSSCDYGNREKYLSFVCQHRAPAVAAHWEHLLSPLVLYHSDSKGIGRFR